MKITLETTIDTGATISVWDNYGNPSFQHSDNGGCTQDTQALKLAVKGLQSENAGLRENVSTLSRLLRDLQYNKPLEWPKTQDVEHALRVAQDILSNVSDDRQLPGHTAQSQNQTPAGQLFGQSHC